MKINLLVKFLYIVLFYTKNHLHSFYFQEELAFVLEMLGLYDEALVQYDELDALFTQFVLNSSVGGMEITKN